MASLTQAQVAAALAEMSYRRAPQDQALDLSDILPGATDANLSENPPQGLTTPDSSGYYYDDNTGFVGRVVETSDTVYVVFRGTDLGATFDITGPDFTHANGPLGLGTTSGTALVGYN
jgi:hypothetical protein